MPSTTTTRKPSTTTKTTLGDAIETTTTTAAVTTAPVYTPPENILIWARANESAIFVTWVTVNASERYPYFWLICFDEDRRQVASADVHGYSYVIGNLLADSPYNVCVTAITYSDLMDPTYCVLVRTDEESPAGTVRTEEGTGLFLIIVIAVPLACLLLVLLIVCIVVVFGYRRRKRRRHRIKSTHAEMTSSTTCDSTGNGGGGQCDPNSAPPAAPRMNLYDEVVPTAPPIHDQSNPLYWNSVTDPLPLQSTLSLNIYDNALSY